jgi:hypothetical protein
MMIVPQHHPDIPWQYDLQGLKHDGEYQFKNPDSN